ncbi:MAG: DedA family protein [Candidatus Micrarchaeia archaeon]
MLCTLVFGLLNVPSLFSLSYSAISSLISKYGYLSIFVLMTLEASSFPIPSEVVLPAVGFFSAKGLLSAYIALPVIFVSSFVGMAINYYIAYFLGKDVVYKHLHLFRLKKNDVKTFEEWFNRNGSFVVFISRLLPIVRGLVNFPAGFALMNQKKFYLYSMAGSMIWDTALFFFGFYALSANNGFIILISIGIFGLALYVIYKVSMKFIRGG